MADSRHDDGAVRLAFQGPHRRPEAGGRGDGPGVVPLRLRLKPGRFSVELTRSGMVFGRHSSADVRLPLPDVSRRHCRFEFEGGRWEVIDLDSLNGIFVNDTLVSRAELHHRDTLRIGGFVFDVDLCGGVTVLAPPDDGELRRAS